MREQLRNLLLAGGALAVLVVAGVGLAAAQADANETNETNGADAVVDAPADEGAAPKDGCPHGAGKAGHRAHAPEDAPDAAA